MKHQSAFILLTMVVLAPQTLQADTLRWNCAYSTMASPTTVSGEKFKLEFAMDTLTKRAVLIGNAGVSDVEVFNGDQGITFQEKLGSGAIQTTTISHKDRKSVHSRHSMLGGTLVPSQYYGDCK
jgi:hypothetical protein